MTKADRASIAQFVRQETRDAILLYLQRNEVNPPEGYNAAEAVRGALYQWVYVPFGNSHALMQLRAVRAGEIPQKLGVIDVLSNKNHKITRDDMLDIMNMQEALCRAVMHNPTFKELETEIGIKDKVRGELRGEVADIKKLIDGASPKEKPDLVKKYKPRLDMLELNLGYILPQNTMAFLTEWALCLDKTDVKKLTAEALLEAAVLATRNNNEPADNLAGVFLTANRAEINKTAWLLYAEKYEKKGK